MKTPQIFISPSQRRSMNQTLYSLSMSACLCFALFSSIASYAQTASEAYRSIVDRYEDGDANLPLPSQPTWKTWGSQKTRRQSFLSTAFSLGSLPEPMR